MERPKKLSATFVKTISAPRALWRRARRAWPVIAGETFVNWTGPAYLVPDG